MKKLLTLALLFTISNCFAVIHPKALVVEHIKGKNEGDYISVEGGILPENERHMKSYTGTYIFEGTFNGFPYWVKNGCVGEFLVKECRCYIYKYKKELWVLVPQPPGIPGKHYGRSDDWLAKAHNNSEWPWEGKWNGIIKNVTINNKINLKEERVKAKVNACPVQPKKNLTNEEVKLDDGTSGITQKKILSELIYDNGGVYKGQMKNGKPHGIGVLIFENGLKYIGEWKNGSPAGIGAKLNKTELYIGNFKNSKKDGLGKIFNVLSTNIFIDKNSQHYIFNIETFNFVAEIDKVIKNLINLNTLKYVGNFNKDLKNGNGHIYYANGAIYSGNFSRNFPTGLGKKTFADGATYDGYFKLGKPHGRGKLKVSDGSKYKGNFSDGLANGYGKKTFANKTSYTGSFKKGIASGKGSYKDSEGRVLSGIWKNGKLIKRIIKK